MTFSFEGPLLLVGAGKMGGAMVTGWLEAGLAPDRILVQDPGPPPEIAVLIASRCLRCQPSYASADLTEPPGVVVLAVKPQVMDAVLATIAPLIGPATLVVSVAAGRTLASMARALPAATAIVRSIPNTPAAIGRGITVAIANDRVTADAKALAQALIESVGAFGWVEDEDLIDVATAVSGSGPAYVFLLAECLAEAGRTAGLPAELAARLANATVSGAGELLFRAHETPAQLRKNVTSPNGTTHAALQVLMGEHGLQELMTTAVARAAARSRELAG